MLDDLPPPFRERAPWFGPDLQTLRNVLLPRPKELEGGERLLLQLRDGDRLAARLDRPARADARPLVVLIHGLTGTEKSVNIVNSARHLVAEGWRVLRLNLRGSAVSRPTSKGRYHAGRTEDLAQALRQLPAPLVTQGIVLVGHSLGGNLILKYLGDGGRDALVRGGVAVSTPIDLAASSVRIQQPRNLFYRRHLLSALKREALAPDADVSAAQREAILSSQSIYEFDNRFIAPCFGFRDADDYYEKNSARRYLSAIDAPTLVIHALDDPWIPASCYEAVDWPRLPMVETAFSPRGGHLGFHGAGSRFGWHDRVAAAWLARLFAKG
ncbi:MAG: alpha/beta fold hydrolase [Methylocystis sp.]|nr:alpha/beta fold hydrolase [Methylocystis sp.]